MTKKTATKKTATKPTAKKVVKKAAVKPPEHPDSKKVGELLHEVSKILTKHNWLGAASVLIPDQGIIHQYGFVSLDTTKGISTILCAREAGLALVKAAHAIDSAHSK